MQLYATATICQEEHPEWIYLSPHLDDVVFSCGGRIALQVRAGLTVWVVTVCAASPEGPLSDYAQLLHAYWGLEEVDAPAARREEDRAALALLGAVAVHWDFRDCIYRRAPDGRFLYPNYDSLWGPVAEEDHAMLEELTGRIAELPSSAGLCVPLGAGRHVDHRLVREAAERTRRPLVYYEDYPYAGEAGKVEEARGEGEWVAEVVTLDGAALEAKIAAALCYRSQITSFWADEADLAAHFRAYAGEVGGESPAERYWRQRDRASSGGRNPAGPDHRALFSF
ncbi:MAG: PIG-L family deacetylase [Anaerolineae bacterium]|nr:PIG-L family deacetylase [Anaerolineae bacterium]MDW8068407.1 PIG-L family deacetylase [Anaerolineae bacterium]